MKVVTLTFHNAVNFGAVLQAVALQRALQVRYPKNEIGILDYRNDKIETKFKPFYIGQKTKSKNMLVKLLQAMAAFPMRYKQRKSFRNFLEKQSKLIPFSREEEKNSAMGSVDMFIVGSDQVWNFDLSGNDYAYLLDFVRDNSKKASYAASFGKTELSNAEREKLEKVKDFRYLSVRENTAAQLLEDITAVVPVVVPDPVFLLPKGEWRKMEKACKKIPDKYILVYRFPSQDESIVEYAKKYAIENNCKVVMIQRTLKSFDGIQVIRDASPEEFLWLIDHAQCVITNSFHGTAFSIIFEKEFISEANVARGTRIKEILSLYGLEEHLFDKNINYKTDCTDWNTVNIRIDEYRQTAFGYLDSIITN